MAQDIPPTEVSGRSRLFAEIETSFKNSFCSKLNTSRICDLVVQSAKGQKRRRWHVMRYVNAGAEYNARSMSAQWRVLV